MLDSENSPNEAVVLILFSRISSNSSNQRWSRGHKARGQGQAHKKMRRHGHEPRTQAKVFSKTSSKFFFQAISKKKRYSKHFFRQSPKQKKVFKTFFQAISKTKKGIQNFFSGNLRKKGHQKILFSGDLQNSSNSKNSTVLEPRIAQFSRT